MIGVFIFLAICRRLIFNLYDINRDPESCYPPVFLFFVYTFFFLSLQSLQSLDEAAISLAIVSTG